MVLTPPFCVEFWSRCGGTRGISSESMERLCPVVDSMLVMTATSSDGIKSIETGTEMNIRTRSLGAMRLQTMYEEGAQQSEVWEGAK